MGGAGSRAAERDEEVPWRFWDGTDRGSVQLPAVFIFFHRNKHLVTTGTNFTMSVSAGPRPFLRGCPPSDNPCCHLSW